MLDVYDRMTGKTRRRVSIYHLDKHWNTRWKVPYLSLLEAVSQNSAWHSAYPFAHRLSMTSLTTSLCLPAEFPTISRHIHCQVPEPARTETNLRPGTTSRLPLAPSRKGINTPFHHPASPSFPFFLFFFSFLNGGYGSSCHAVALCTFFFFTFCRTHPRHLATGIWRVR